MISSLVHKSLWESPPAYKLPDNFKEVQGVKVFEFRGCNGSGKSTLPKMLVANDHLAKEIDISNVKLTYCPTFKTVIVGRYPTDTNCGGCDRISGNQNIADSVVTAIKFAKTISSETGSGIRVLYEGIMASTTCFGITSLFLGEDNGVPNSDFSICFMQTSIETCLSRISKRNGGVEFKESNVRNKHRQVNNQPPTVSKEHNDITLLKVENDDTPFEDIILNWCSLNYKEYVF